MKVVCIDNMKRGKLRIGDDSYLPLTIGKIYDAIDMKSGASLYFYLYGDNNKPSSFDSWRFISLEEWIQNQREKQLNNLGL